MIWPVTLCVFLTSFRVHAAPANESETNGVQTIASTLVTEIPSTEWINSSNINSETTTEAPTVPPKSLLGESCKVNGDCWGDHVICSEKEKCTCERGYFRSKENNHCLKIIEVYGDKCSVNEECRRGLQDVVGSTSCINFQCICSLGLSLIKGECKPTPKLGIPCITSEDCHAIEWSYCLEKFCVCKKNFVSSHTNDSCLPVPVNRMKALLGESVGCAEDTQCQQIMGDYAMCDTSNGECTCHPGYHSVNDKGCIPFLKLDERCTRDEECVSKHITVEKELSRYCNKSVCSCNIGYIRAGDDLCTSGSKSPSLTGVMQMALMMLIWVNFQ